ncbi:ribonuclease J [Geminicoccus flavidas]|uniref:ribonuclease J n=1 Tax=Geminicoccus flavidas TaxID=2506407 RepID=UPI00135A19BA|nr:ribonuclease J [Geminicoccus flavidas]
MHPTENTPGLRFIPLGGVGEIGMNTALYGVDGQWLMVDLGISFADESLPGVDIILPDIGFAERLPELEGLVITHAHEDHYGGVPYLWPRLRCPIWCTPFVAAALERKLDDVPFGREVQINIVEPGHRFRVGAFELSFIHVTHSVPDANALVLHTEYGNVLHTGDWKLDPEPLVGARTPIDQLTELGRDGVLAMLGDSTNALRPGDSGSEAEVRDSLIELVGRQKKRVLLTTFSSNIARIGSMLQAAKATGRIPAIVGRSMLRMLEAAREVGYLEDAPRPIDAREAASLQRDKVLLICTGSQGEPRSALARIAGNSHPFIKLEAGDTAIFSSKIIPGNERKLYDMHNQLVRNGVEVITEEDHFVHVSGHPSRDELERMIRWIRPKILVPVHGEPRHLRAHHELARTLGVPNPIRIDNGDVLMLAPGDARVVDSVPTGRLALDSNRIRGVGDELFRTRRRLMNHGTIMVSLVLDGYGSVLAPPIVADLGAGDHAPQSAGRDVIDAVVAAVEALSDDDAAQDERVKDAVRTAVRQAFVLPRDRRPIIEVQVTRLDNRTLDALEDD